MTAFKAVTDVRFGNAKVNSVRGPGVRNIDLSVIRTMVASKSVHLQVRVEIFNLMNRPTFANPTNVNVSNLLFNADGSVRDLNGVGVINTTQFAGREYSERYVRLGMRLSF